jgi:hypothetical protein
MIQAECISSRRTGPDEIGAAVAEFVRKAAARRSDDPTAQTTKPYLAQSTRLESNNHVRYF